MSSNLAQRRVWAPQRAQAGKDYAATIKAQRKLPAAPWVYEGVQGRAPYGVGGCTTMFDILIPGPDGVKLVQAQDNTVALAIGEDSKMDWEVPQEFVTGEGKILPNRMGYFHIDVIDDDGPHRIIVNPKQGTFKPKAGGTGSTDPYHLTKYTIKARKVANDEAIFKRFGLTFSIVGGNFPKLKAVPKKPESEEAPPKGSDLDVTIWDDREVTERLPRAPVASKGHNIPLNDLAKVAVSTNGAYHLVTCPDGYTFLATEDLLLRINAMRQSATTKPREASDYLTAEREEQVIMALQSEYRSYAEIVQVWQDADKLEQDNQAAIFPDTPLWASALSRARGFIWRLKNKPEALPDGYRLDVLRKGKRNRYKVVAA